MTQLGQTRYIMAPVPIKTRKLSKDEGGGYLATIPPWEATYIADGETEEEAVTSLIELCHILETDFINSSAKEAE